METALNRDPFTLTRWLLTKQQQYPEATGDFTIILNSIQLAIKIISSAASQAGIYQLYGVSQFKDKNASNDQVKKLDTFANDCMINCLRFTRKVRYMVSEEEDSVMPIPEAAGGRYIVSFDPLDGSSNIDANVSVGTIFGIWRTNPGDDQEVKDESPEEQHERLKRMVSRPGTELVCAGYAMYGDATVLVLTFNEEDESGVTMFTLDPQMGEFIRTFEHIKMPEGNIYSVNEGNTIKWDEPMQQYVDSCKRINEAEGRFQPMKARYVGSMVADIHRTLLYGGIFLYPAEPNGKNKTGKLRLLYEAAPMAFIMERAGGMAHTGSESILHVLPNDPHMRVPVIMGSRNEVVRALKMLNPGCVEAAIGRCNELDARQAQREQERVEARRIEAQQVALERAARRASQSSLKSS